MRAELLEVLSLLIPEKRWRKLVPARELAEFTIRTFPDYSTVEREQRALNLAHFILAKLRSRAPK